jgi:hypothetical protein
MREVLIFNPGDTVRYIGEKELKVVLPSSSAYIAGRMDPANPYSEALVEHHFTIYPNTSGVVVPNHLAIESSDYAIVKFLLRDVEVHKAQDDPYQRAGR